MRRLFLIAALLFAHPVFAATTRYVATTGNNANGPTCAIGSPCATFAYVAPLNDPGDTVIVRGGSYTGQAIELGGDVGQCPTCKNGTNAVEGSGQITWKAATGEMVTVGYIDSGYAYYEFNGINVDGTSFGAAGGMTITGEHNWYHNGEIAHTGSDCISANGFTAGHQTFTHIGPNVILHDCGNRRPYPSVEPTAQAHGIYMKGGDYNTVEGVEFYDLHQAVLGSYCLQIYDNTNPSHPSHETIKNNKCHDSEQGFTAQTGGTDSIFYNNIVYDIAGSGFLIVNYTNIQMFNNSINDVGGFGIAFYSTTTGSAKNNLVCNSAAAVIEVDSSAATTTLTNNLTCGSIDNNSGSTVLSGNSTTNEAGIKWHAASSGDFTLDAMSDAIGFGVNLYSTFTTDYSGAARASMGAWDNGAYVRTAATCTPAKVLFITQPSNATLGASLGPVSAGIYSSSDQLCTSATNAITFAKAGGATWGTLAVTSGSLSSNTPAAGIVTLSTMYVSTTAGSGSITAAASGLTTATSNSITISNAIPPCGGVYMGCKLYVDFVGGNDTLSGADMAHAWKHAPGMTGAGTNPETLDVDGLDLSGLSIIFKGGVTWTSAVLPWTLRGKGTGSTIGTTAYYIGVDKSWYTGASWARPILNYGGSTGGFICTRWIFGQSPGVQENPDGYRIVDNFEFTNLYWDHTCDDDSRPSYWGRNTGTGNELKNLYFHGWSYEFVNAGTTACITNPSVHICNEAGYMAATPGFVACGYTGRNCDIFNAIYGDGGTGSSIHDSVFDGSDVDNKMVGNSGFGIRGQGASNVYRNIFKHVVSGQSTIQTITSFHDNTCDTIGESTSTQHDQCYQDNGSTGDTYVYNNLVKDSNAGQGFLLGPHVGYKSYWFNNVIYNSSLGSGLVYCQDTNHSAEAGTCNYFNNTIYDNFSTLTVGCGYFSPGNPSSEGCVYRNNHFMTDTANLLSTCTVSSSNSCTQDHNIVQTLTAAASDGFTSGSMPPYFPTSSGADTIAAGTNLGSLCSINAYLANICITSTAGVNYDSTNHAILGPLVPDTATRNATPDDGAYQFNASAPLIVSVTPNHAATPSVIDVTIVGQTTGWTVDSVPTLSGSGVTTLYWTFYDSAHILATFVIDSGLAAAYRDVTVTTGIDVVTLGNGFHIDGPVIPVLKLTPRRFRKI